jgi:hypothetical protein
MVKFVLVRQANKDRDAKRPTSIRLHITDLSFQYCQMVFHGAKTIYAPH